MSEGWCGKINFGFIASNDKIGRSITLCTVDISLTRSLVRDTDRCVPCGGTREHDCSYVEYSKVTLQWRTQKEFLAGAPLKNPRELSEHLLRK